ncbi:unnamed protein product [Phytophthora lilii]|uniref:Unnamed protein product n=1 Tax=Phytophthora lilii TaxID=2077276 RepID=A0A9W6U400_9STRA|nr:unnamed protein product [Phytophthora lilii]
MKAVEMHLKWCSCEPTPFVSLFGDEAHAINWARKLLENRQQDVFLLELDSSKLGLVFCVRDLVLHHGAHTTLPESMYEDEYLVLRKIVKRNVTAVTVVSQVTALDSPRNESDFHSESSDDSDSDEEQSSDELTQNLRSLRL